MGRNRVVSRRAGGGCRSVGTGAAAAAAVRAWALAVALAAGLLAPARTVHGAPAPDPTSPAERARQIKVPVVSFEQTSLADVVRFLAKRSRELDPQGTGVNLVLVPPPADAKPALVNLELRSISLLAATDYAARSVGWRLTPEASALVLQPGAEASVPATAPAAGQASPTADRARAIVIPHLEFDGAPVPQVLAFLAKRSIELDPEGIGVNFVLLLAPGTKPPAVTLNLDNIPLFEAARYMALCSGLEMVPEPEALVIQPKAVQPTPGK